MFSTYFHIEMTVGEAEKTYLPALALCLPRQTTNVFELLKEKL